MYLIQNCFNCRPDAGTEFVNVLRSPEIDSAGLCSLAGRYNNPIPTRFPAPIDRLKIPALFPADSEIHTVKKRFAIFLSSAGMSLTNLPLDGNNLFIPVQGEFGW
jgi:hypothetical protein